MRTFLHQLPPLRSRRRERLERGSLLIAIVTVHLLLLLWLVTRPPTKPVPRDSGGDLVLVSVSDGKATATPPTVQKPPPPPTLVPPPAVILPSVIPAPTAAQNPLPAGTGAPQPGDADGCALASVVDAAIAKDPAAMAELAALPPAYRTAADAVMLWNGEWLTITSGSTALPVAPSLRRAVEQAVAEAKPECSGAMMSGPQFLAIPEPGRVTTLVIGSGAWRWSELVTSETACLGTASDSCGAQTPRP